MAAPPTPPPDAPQAPPGPPKLPSAEALLAAHQRATEKREGDARKAATLAERLTEAYAHRRLVVHVGGQQVPIRYPAEAMRARVAETTARLHVQVNEVERGVMPPHDEQVRLQADVIAIASELVLDPSLTAEWFARDTNTIEVAASIVLAAEGALRLRRDTAAAFRPDAGRPTVREPPPMVGDNAGRVREHGAGREGVHGGGVRGSRKAGGTGGGKGRKG